MSWRKIMDFILKLLGLGNKSRIPKKETEVDKKSLEVYEEEVKKDEKKKPEILPIGFKTDRVEEEFQELRKKNRPLYEAIVAANEFTSKKFGKNLVLTMIFRTQAEQDYLYRNNARYQKKKFKSPHQFWQAVDLRSRTFTEEEIEEIEEWFNSRYDKKNYWKWTAKAHNIGAGMHFHIQFIEG